MKGFRIMSNELVKVIGGNEIRAREPDHYINATELAKAAGKQWADYARLDGTKGFIQALAQSTGIPVDELVQSKSGNGGGTWVHPRVVIHFAQWASPDFAAAVTGWVLELVTTGRVEVSPPVPRPDALAALKSQLRAELMAALTTALTAELSPIVAEVRALSAPVPHERMVTIRDQCRHWGWAHPSERQQTEIRNRAYELHLEKYGEVPTKLWGRCLWVGEDQITLLSQAIVDVRNEYDRRTALSGPHIPGTV